MGSLLHAVGQPIPADTSHVRGPYAEVIRIFTDHIPQAVSVSLPTWKANIGYEEGEYWVLSKMQTGYPRYTYAVQPRKQNTAD